MALASQRRHLTQERLMELLHYDPESGIFRWRKDRNSRMRAGDLAGSEHEGYTFIGVEYGRYPAHRLAWFYMTGEWPEGMVDHKNVCPSDNRWANLRLADYSQQRANTFKSSRNKSGFKGISWQPHAKAWMAMICHKGKQIYLGHYRKPEDAHAAYAKKASELFGEYARAG